MGNQWGGFDRTPRVRPCIIRGRRHMVWSPRAGVLSTRPYRWWSPVDWVRDGWDWWAVRRHF